LIGDLGRSVRRELDKLGTGGAIVDVVRVWPSAVGEQIARNAWPARIARDGTLHVATSSSAWAFELGQLEAEIRGRLGELAPPRLRFAAGALPEGHESGSKPAKPAPPRPTPAEWAEAERLAAKIEAEELRNLVTRAAAASLAKARSDRSF
jgi:Dna[CI] antecedent, DciA